MATIECGTPLRYGVFPPGLGGCLVRFASARQRLLLLTAGHVILPSGAKPGDEIQALDLPAGQPLGRLRTWTSYGGPTTADVALVWVDPARISATIAGLGAPTGVNVAPKVGDVLRLCPAAGSTQVRETKIFKLGFETRMSVVGPDTAAEVVTFRDQIVCRPAISDPGDSGAVMLDVQNRVVGMVMGGSEDVGDIITPIGPILAHPDWASPLELVTQVPVDVQSPFDAAAASLAAPAAPPPNAGQFSQLKPGYEALYAGCQIRPEYAGQVEWHRKMLLKNRKPYEAVEQATGAPWWFVGVVHALEGTFNFATHLHNGDPLSTRTTHVPAGRPAVWNPPSDWASSAIDAITYEGFAHQADWSLARTLYRFESYNGYGYYAKGVNSPYLWSFSNQYAAGKFVADHKYDPAAVSKQCGAAVMLKALVDHGDIAAPSV